MARRMRILLTAIILLSSAKVYADNKLDYMQMESNETQETLILGVVPQHSPNQLYLYWQPIVDYLEGHIGIKVQLKTVKSIAGFAERLYQGDYDLAFMNPMHFVKEQQLAGRFQPLVRVSKPLRGILVTNKGIGKEIIKPESKFLFPSSEAFGATVLIKHELKTKFNLDVDNEQNYQYVNSHDSVYLGVSQGFGDIGGGVQRTLMAYDSHQDNPALHVIHVTEAYPSHLMAIQKKYPAALQKKIQQAFLDMPKTLLKPIYLDQFVTAKPQDFDKVKNLLHSLGSN